MPQDSASTPVPAPTIGHVLHRMHVAGAEVLAADLSRRLGHRFRFLFLCLDGLGSLGEELRAEGFGVYDLRRKPGVDWSVALRLRRILRQENVALLHAHQYTPFFYAAAARGLGSRPPILFTEHGRAYPDPRRPKRVMANQFLLRRRDRVTAVGRFVKQALIDKEAIAAGRIEVVYNGIDPEKFRTSSGDARRAVRAELALGDDQPVALQVARFHPVKDHGTALRAFAQVARRLPAAVLLLAGEGELRAALEALTAELGIQGNVRFLGVRSDVPRLMAAADVFVLSSLSEGISVTLLEAMGCELPIAATDVGGNGEVVLANTTGLLSPRQDAPKLAENLLALLGDAGLRRRLGQAGREHLLRQFTQDQMHAHYTAIYHEMLQQGR